MDLLDDILRYLTQFLPPQALKSFSLTCKYYSDIFHVKGEAVRLCCKYDDRKLYKKLVKTVKNEHLLWSLDYGSFKLFELLNPKDYSAERQLLLTLLKGFESITPEAVNHELEHRHTLCKKLDIEDFSARWYEAHKLVFVCNIILIIEGARNAFYCDLFYSKKFILEMKQNYQLAYGIVQSVSGDIILFINRNYLPEYERFIDEGLEFEVITAKVLGYGYVGNDYREDSIFISFDLSDCDLTEIAKLYGYFCPKAKFTALIKKYNKEKVKSFNHILVPLGFKVVCNIYKF